MVKEAKNPAGLRIVTGVPATILDMSDRVMHLKNDKKTPYRLGNVAVKYPDGSTEDFTVRFYENHINLYPNTFAVGGNIDITIQVEGEYAGMAVSELPNAKRADVDKVLSFLADSIADAKSAKEENAKAGENITTGA